MEQSRIYTLPIKENSLPDANAQVDVSVVVPVFNEEPLLEELHFRINNVCKELKKSFEILVVDDGSVDGSFAKLNQLKEENPNLRIIRFTRNFGQQAAVLAAFRHCRGDIVVQIDSDLQNPPEEIPKLLNAMTEGVDLVTTRARKRSDGVFRSFGSRFLLWLGQVVSGNSFKLSLSSFRAMRKSVLEKIELCSDRSRYMAVLMSWMAVPSVEIEVEHHPRSQGKTKYRFFTLVKLALDLITGFSNMPLRVVTYLGFFSSVLGFILSAFLLYQRLFQGILVDGFVVLSAVFSFFAGVQLFSVGILGEYLGRVYLQVQNRPDYIIDKVVD